MLARVVLLALLLVAVPTAMAQDSPLQLPSRDNDHVSWVHQVIPVLYGRKPRGYSEIRLLADLAAKADRGRLLEALMASEEFAEHWSDVIVEHLRVNRDGDKDLTGCYAPTGSQAGKDKALAEFIRGNGPDAPFTGAGGGFNMGDVVRSSILLDDLSPIFLAHMFPLVGKPLRGNEIKERQRQADLLVNFENIYLNRKGTCLVCHNSSFSVTGRMSYWSRAHPVPGHFEEALYRHRTGPQASPQVSTFLRSDAAMSGAAPWGLTGCGAYRRPPCTDRMLTDKPDAEPDAEPCPPAKIELTPDFAGIESGIVSVFDLEGALRAGFERLRSSGMIERTVSPVDMAYCRLCRPCEGLPDQQAPDQQQQDERAKVAIGILHKSCGSPGSCHGPTGRQPFLKIFELATEADKELKRYDQHVIRHPAGRQPACALVAPADAAHSYLWQKMQPATGSADPNCRRVGLQMPTGGGSMTPEDMRTLETWIEKLPQSAGCKGCSGRKLEGCPTNPADLDNPNAYAPLKVEPESSFAVLASAALVNRVWTEAMGFSLTVANYFPRSEGQGERLRTLTETVFIKNEFSLKTLLKDILTSSHFNRIPPARGTAGLGDIYDIPLSLDPWVEADPRKPPVAQDGWTPGSGSAPVPDPAYRPAERPDNHKNAMTEGIRRYPASSLIRSAYTALGWPVPKLFPDLPSGGLDPSAVDLAKQTGLFMTDAEPGFRAIDLLSLLGWEYHLGRCDRPSTVQQGVTDWIDRLVLEVGRLGAADPRRMVTRREAAAAVKDWLIGDLAISEDREAAAVAPLLGWRADRGLTPSAYLGQAAPIDAASLQALSRGLRRYCGVLLGTPQFQLGGAAGHALAPPAHDAAAVDPRLRVCNGTPCSYRELCEAIAPAVRGYTVACPPPGAPPSQAVVVTPAPVAPPAAIAATQLDAVCPPGRCYVMTLPKGCRGDAARCARQLPLCDPRASTCGGPTDLAGRIDALRQGAVLVAEIEGASIAELRGGERQLGPGSASVMARVGDRLEAGEVLRLKLGQTITLERASGAGAAGLAVPPLAPGEQWRLTTDGVLPPQPRAGPTGPEPVGDLTVIVSGPTLRAAARPDRVMKSVPEGAIEPLQEQTWRRHGEAGAPIGDTGSRQSWDADEIRRRSEHNAAQAERARRMEDAIRQERARRAR